MENGTKNGVRIEYVPACLPGRPPLDNLKVAENALGGRVARSISRALLATVELALSFATTLT